MPPPSEPGLVTIVVQAFNTAPYIGECLESVFALAGATPFEVVVIDDASTDGTAEIASRVCDPRLRVVIHDRNVGAVATANDAYRSGRGEFLLRLDSDDRLRPDFLLETIPVLVRNPAVGFVYGDVVTIGPDGRQTSSGGVLRRGARHRRAGAFVSLLLENDVPAPATVVRRSALDPLLPIPGDLSFVDWYITTGIADTWQTVFVDRPIADYRVHPSNMHRTMILDRRGEATSLRILDGVFARPSRRTEKRRWRSRVYARTYLSYADKYFGEGMTADARRCYWHAVQRRPLSLADWGTLRRFAATFAGRRLYDAAKRLVATR